MATIIIIAGIVLGGVLLFVVDDLWDKLVDRTFPALGLQSGQGPLAIDIGVEGDRTVLTLVNQGKHSMKLVAIEGRDRLQQQKFPVPYASEQDLRQPIPEDRARKEFVSRKLKPGEAATIFLSSAELTALDCQTLAVLDASGKSWPVDAYPSESVPLNENGNPGT